MILVSLLLIPIIGIFLISSTISYEGSSSTSNTKAQSFTLLELMVALKVWPAKKIELGICKAI